MREFGLQLVHVGAEVIDDEGIDDVSLPLVPPLRLGRLYLAVRIRGEALDTEAKQTIEGFEVGFGPLRLDEEVVDVVCDVRRRLRLVDLLPVESAEPATEVAKRFTGRTSRFYPR